MARMLHRRLNPRNWQAMTGVARPDADLPSRKGEGSCRADGQPKPGRDAAVKAAALQSPACTTKPAV
jgi:hypothetical protein